MGYLQRKTEQPIGGQSFVFPLQLKRLTRTMARNAKEKRWTRLIGFWVDTVWALKRLASSIAVGIEEGREGEREEDFLGGGALLLVDDDVLVMWRAEATVGGHGGAAD